MIAGILVVAGISVLILIHELGHFLAAKLFKVRVDEFGIGFPPRLIRWRGKETSYTINLLPFGGFVKMRGEDGSEEGAEGGAEDSRRRFDQQPAGRRALIISAGVIMNIFLGWVLLVGVFAAGSPVHLLVANVAADSPAVAADLRGGDIIMSAVSGNRELADPVASRDFIDLVQAAAGGEIFLQINRGGEILEKNVASRAEPPSGQGPIGIGLAEIGWPSQNFFRAIAAAGQQTAVIFVQTVAGFWNFFSRLFFDPGVIQSVSGPVGIFSIAVQASDMGFGYFLHLLALLSINLAVLNILPLPALDGGRLVFLAIEKIRRSPVPVRWQAIVNASGFALLILLLIVITIKDFKGL